MFTGLSTFRPAVSAPLEDTRAFGDESTKITARATPGAPHFVIYSDKFVSGETGPPPVAQVQGYNVLCVAFVAVHSCFSIYINLIQRTVVFAYRRRV